ncbi:serine/threonine-protein kinase [Streptomyces sp. NPDC089795]|uniref:serine/threonine-protein kinase n=1 Tax=Streptomyces sp. NPDC089795 TaxID=3155297 RepID=UPI0034373F98
MRGELLDGRYRLEERLGGGGMGEVWAAEDLRMRRPVAVKLVRTVPGTAAAEVEQRFTHEVRSAANLPHQHTVTVHDCGEAVLSGGRLLYLVMERLDGRTLAQVFRGAGSAASAGGAGAAAAVPWYDVADWARQIATALGAAHERGIVHRDIKPQNVMLTGTGVIKVLDFGLAKFLGETLRLADLTATGTAMGTLAYMSPEQCRGDSGIDHRTDLYSLGCLLYEGLTGQPPFTNPAPHALLYQQVYESPPPLAPGTAPAGITDLVMFLLAKHPAHRPPDAATVVRELERHLSAHEKPAAGPAAAPEDAAAREARRHADALRLIQGSPADVLAYMERIRREVEEEGRPIMEAARLESRRIVAEGLADQARRRTP